VPGYKAKTPWTAFAHALGVPGDKLVTRHEKTQAAAIDAAIYLMLDPYYQRPEGRVGVHKGNGSITLWRYSAGKWKPSTVRKNPARYPLTHMGAYTVHVFRYNDWMKSDPGDRWIDVSTKRKALEVAEQVMGERSTAGKWVAVRHTRSGRALALFQPDGGNWKRVSGSLGVRP